MTFLFRLYGFCQNRSGGAGADAAGPRIQHGLGILPGADPAGSLDPHLWADCFPHQRDIGGGGPTGGKAGGRFDKGGAGALGDLTAADLFLLGQQAGLQHHLDARRSGGLHHGGDILFRVTDDGVGMEPELAASLLHREPTDRTGIGIKNVHERLRIYFGEPYGLGIESEPDVGTTVTVRMPKVKEGEYEPK